MGAVYHRGSSQIASTSESHEGDLIILRYDRSSWRVGLLQCSHSLKRAWQVSGQSRRQDFRGVIDLLLSWRESIGRKRDRGGGECKGKLQPSNLAFSTTKRMDEVKYPSSLTYPVEELCISSGEKDMPPVVAVSSRQRCYLLCLLPCSLATWMVAPLEISDAARTCFSRVLEP
ncbi:hypothetical protein B296_00038910 [Ensete ventricosum]|uniref:Uncharacterized protein n=1 Tax=Ensete ventricosum TaxID=4639 RepID=A0A426X7V0_ENSVE|nr:hypothetical protein B296_00038910 [Ensete ventricosum]